MPVRAWGHSGGEYSPTVVSSVRPGATPDPVPPARSPSGRDLRRPDLARPHGRRAAVHSGGDCTLNAFMGDSVASPLVWAITIVVTVGLLARRPARDRPAPARADDAPRCRRHLVFFVGLAVVFGLALWLFAEPHALSPNPGPEFFAGWLTEYSLSVDNLFIFIIIMAKFAVPRQLPADRADDRHRAGAGHARDLHRRRRRGDQQVQLGVLHLRRVPALHGVEAGHGGRRGRRRRSTRRTGCVRFAESAPAGHQGVARHQAVHHGRTASA